MRSLALLLVIGCASKPDANGDVFDVGGTPSLAADPGQAAIMSGDFVDITVTNTGDAITGDLAAVITGSGAASFMVAAGTTCSVLAPGGSCVVRVGAPATNKATSATAQLVVSDATTNAMVDLSTDGSTTGGGTLVVTPATAVVDSSGCPSAPSTIYTLTNHTGQKVASLQISTTDPNRFHVESACDDKLDDGASCDVVVAAALPTATPTTAGLKAVATLTTDDSAVSATAVIQGSGAHACDAAIAPATLKFTAAKGTTSPGQMISITNNGTAPRSFEISFDQTEYTDATQGCVAPTLAGATCITRITFAPPEVLDYPAVLTVRDKLTDVLEGTVALTGTGVATMAFDHAVVDLGMVKTGQQSVIKMVVLTTIAPTGALTVAPPAPPFLLVSNGCTSLPSGGLNTCSISVSFAPTAAGEATSSITATAASGDKATVMFHGTATQGFTNK